MSDRAYQLFGLKIFGEFTGAIALPVVVLVFLGRWLDGRWETGYTMQLIGLALAALISGTTIYHRAKQIGREYQRLIDEEKNNDSHTRR